MSRMVEHQSSFLYNITELLSFAYSQGYMVTGGELERTVEQQEIYVKTGKSFTMNSMHLKRCAIDLHFFKGGKLIEDKTTLQVLGDYFESLDVLNRWGGNFVVNGKPFEDTVHFERKV